MVHPIEHITERLPTRVTGSGYRLNTYHHNEVANEISFPIACSHSISSSKIDESVDSDTESFQVPDLPDEIVLTRAQIPDVAKRNSNDMKGTVDLMKEAELSAHGVLINSFDEMESTWKKRNSNDMKGTVDLIKEAELSALGVLINSFDKMESKYADVYRKLVKKVWCVGPISLCDKDLSDKIDRGHKASIDEHYCLKWLDSMKPGSPLSDIMSLIDRTRFGVRSVELPLCLHNKKRRSLKKMKKWLADENFEVRIVGRGLMI
ncbi:hypothetical protein HYC85_006777 [Camellia sinensis]|uniref:Uncharacterized protein n=1 Tax=Camellia sinensis TaxID=4442 RepID=A0A7J7HNY5_CAMSI|nr:hypothetical protein HYC85_006777 [Camellia sinensis]